MAHPHLLARTTATRPWWATCASLFCAVTLIFLVVRDLALPDVRDTEVWLGLEVHGWLARASAPLHWLLFATGAWAFWTLQPRVWPWASLYVFQVAASHLVWNLTSASGGGWVAGLWQAAALCVPAVALLWARPPRPTDAASGILASLPEDPAHRRDP